MRKRWSNPSWVTNCSLNNAYASARPSSAGGSLSADAASGLPASEQPNDPTATNAARPQARRRPENTSVPTSVRRGLQHRGPERTSPDDRGAHDSAIANRLPGGASLVRQLALRRQETGMALVATLESLDAGSRSQGVLAALRRFPAEAAACAPFPDDLHPKLIRVLAERGIESLYTHQREAYDAVQAGRHLVVVTPTASGKTLCYNLPILDSIL